MYRYDAYDKTLVLERVAEFRGQVARRLSGSLSEEQFRPLRLMNGLYLQLHAYMLRVAIPYGTLSSGQMRKLAEIARRYDKGYGHFTTRQNIQFNWPELSDVPDILADLAAVEMHAIQTSGNVIRNVTTDHFAGVARDEVADPRPYAELIRQWSTLHPEFSFLPRKFKIAVTGCEKDRAAIRLHDIGLELRRRQDGEIGFRVIVGGGMGRTPMIGPVIREHLQTAHLLSYLEAILRVYNQHGRRDNKYKARIKILVHALGTEEFTRQVEAEWVETRDGPLRLPQAALPRIEAMFTPPDYSAAANTDARASLENNLAGNGAFAAWVESNVDAHSTPGHAIVTISLKPHGGIPGDASALQMEAVADLAERFSFAEIRVSHEQNLILPHVREDNLHDLWRLLESFGLGAANAGLLTDIIACPGLDYCSLANARSIPLAQKIARRFGDGAQLRDIGDLKIKISGCINACGHHHVGHIGILGVEKKGEELYQLMLGGSGAEDASLARITGPGFSEDGVIDAIERVIDIYLEFRAEGENFLHAYRRLGAELFKQAIYAGAKKNDAA